MHGNFSLTESRRSVIQVNIKNLYRFHKVSGSKYYFIKFIVYLLSPDTLQSSWIWMYYNYKKQSTASSDQILLADIFKCRFGKIKCFLCLILLMPAYFQHHIPSVIFFVYSLKINLSLRYMVRVISTILSKGCEMQREVSTRLGAYPLILRRVRSFFVSVDTVS